jgi:hypothetical protein
LPAILCLSILLIGVGCFRDPEDEDSENSTASSENDPFETSVDENDPTGTAAPETTAVSETEMTESETIPESTLLTDINSIEIYSSHAYMVSFDPSTGLAEFDYFDMLTGQDAINWLVEHEGYTQEDAEAKVNNFADTEYVEKNINPQLRTIDMTTVSITTNVDENGYLALPQVPLTYNEFKNRIDDFIHTSSNYCATQIKVENGVIVEIIVDVFMG